MPVKPESKDHIVESDHYLSDGQLALNHVLVEIPLDSLCPRLGIAGGLLSVELSFAGVRVQVHRL